METQSHPEREGSPEVPDPPAAVRSVPFPAWSLYGSNSLVLEIDLSIYDINAVFSTAYKFTDRCGFFFSRNSVGEKRLFAFLIERQPSGRLNDLLKDFCNELIDQQLREALLRESGGLREIIVAQAFAEGNLLDSDRDEGDYQTDARGAGKRR